MITYGECILMNFEYIMMFIEYHDIYLNITIFSYISRYLININILWIFLHMAPHIIVLYIIVAYSTVKTIFWSSWVGGAQFWVKSLFSIKHRWGHTVNYPLGMVLSIIFRLSCSADNMTQCKLNMNLNRYKTVSGRTSARKHHWNTFALVDVVVVVVSCWNSSKSKPLWWLSLNSLTHLCLPLVKILCDFTIHQLCTHVWR